MLLDETVPSPETKGVVYIKAPLWYPLLLFDSSSLKARQSKAFPVLYLDIGKVGIFLSVYYIFVFLPLSHYTVRVGTAK